MMDSRQPPRLPTGRVARPSSCRAHGLDPVRGMRVVRLRDIQRDCAVICSPLQHYFLDALLPVMQAPCCLEPHHGFAVCSECGYRDAVVVERLSSSRFLRFGKDWHVRPAGPGRGCYGVLRTGTVTVAQ
jgi:hypothetical protein